MPNDSPRTQLPTGSLCQLQAAACALLRAASIDARFEEVLLPKLSREPHPTQSSAVRETDASQKFVTSYFKQLYEDPTAVGLVIPFPPLP